MERNIQRKKLTQISVAKASKHSGKTMELFLFVEKKIAKKRRKKQIKLKAYFGSSSLRFFLLNYNEVQCFKCNYDKQLQRRRHY